jgi:hypothetical protein
MLAAFMDGTYQKSRWVDNIVFFGLFIAVLLIAYLIVLWKSALVLSKPIELKCAGLSVCIPAGNGWQSEERWKYQQNTFTLDSFFTPGSGSITAVVSCRYLLAAPEIAPQELFKEKASAVRGSKITKTGQITNTPLNANFPVLNWARIENSTGGIRETETPLDIFFGTAQMPDSRRLEIEVRQTTDGAGLAQEIFNSVVHSLKFTENHLLEDGGKIVSEIKNKGLDSFLASISGRSAPAEQGLENLFLIKDAGKRTIGFAMEAMAPSESGRFRAESFYYIRDRRNQEQLTFFLSGNNLDEFAWKSETSGPSSRSGTEITLSKNGIMTVKELGLQTEEKDYHVSLAAIPDILDEFIFCQMIDSNSGEIFVDIIDSDSKILPAHISRIEMGSSPASKNRSGETDLAPAEAYVFGIEYLDGRGFSEQVYLDGQRRISRMLLRQEVTYTIERTDAEDILREFPKMGGLILHGSMDSLQKKDNLLEQEQPQDSGEE